MAASPAPVPSGYDYNLNPANAQVPQSEQAPSPYGTLAGYPTTASGGPAAGGTFGYMTLASTGVEAINTGRQADVLGQELSAAGGKELTDYQKYLDKMTSTDPSTRMAAQATNIQTEEKQQTAARAAISTLPRGGAQDYLSGQSYIQQASDIGTLLDQAWNQAETAKGQLGLTEEQLALQSLSTAQSGFSVGGSIQGGALDIKNNMAAANQALIANDIGMLASLAAGL